jgi:hypothetical protein
MILSEDTAQLILIPKNAQTELEKQTELEQQTELERQTLRESGNGGAPTWRINYPSVEDYKLRRQQLGRTLRATGIGSFVMCGFLFTIYGMAYSVIYKSEKK